MVGKTDAFAIDLHHVAKVYGRKTHALRDIAMQVGHGEIFGLLGPNGAGKTTLVKIIMTVTRATRAEGTVLGRSIGHRATLRRVGYLPEECRFAPYLTGRQVLGYYAALSKVGRRARKRRAAELLAAVGMSDWADAKVGTYSKGMIQRLGLAQALTHDPQLVLLDEPTDGLDPMGRRDVRLLLTALRQRGGTIFINSHMLSEVEMICDRVAILNSGTVVRQGSLEELTRGRRLYEIETEGAELPVVRDLVSSALGDRASTVELHGECVRVEGVDAASIQPAVDALRARQMVIRSIRPVRQSLEDLFIETVTDSQAAPPPPAPRAVGPAAPLSEGAGRAGQ